MPNLQILKSIAEEKKITLRKIAEAAGLTEQGLHKAINKEDIKLSYIDKIANFLKVDLYVFSDYSSPKENETKVSSIGNNQGEIAGGNIIKVSLPETGQQKIINPDGTTIIEPISLNKEGVLASEERKAFEDKISLQQQLIESLQDQLAMYKEKNKS